MSGFVKFFDLSIHYYGLGIFAFTSLVLIADFIQHNYYRKFPQRKPTFYDEKKYMDLLPQVLIISAILLWGVLAVVFFLACIFS